MEAMSKPKLFFTSMSSDRSAENATESIEPIINHLDGVIYVLNDVSPADPSARYLESVKGCGKVIHRSFIPRHHHLMSDTLFTGLIEEGDYVLWADPLERPMPPFVSRIKTEIGPLMEESDLDVIAYYGKSYLLRYRETMEYRNSPHWSLAGWNGRAIEWSKIEPDEKQVRWNVRPLKRTDPYHWVGHMLRYWLFPEGSNSAALGLDHFPPGDRSQQFIEREARRLAFRRLMRKRGFPLTVEGFVALCKADLLDEELRAALNAEKTLSDGYHWLVCANAAVKDSHNPSDAIPVL